MVPILNNYPYSISNPKPDKEAQLTNYRGFGVWGSKIGFPVPKMCHFPVPKNHSYAHECTPKP